MARVLLAVPSLHTQIKAHHESKKQNATEIVDGYMLNFMNLRRFKHFKNAFASSQQGKSRPNLGPLQIEGMPLIGFFSLMF